ncbi:MAG: endonuclease [Deinococcus sp.]|uniref:endonuclease n=1 Tax=Deinococcus sp. TaxID=47478 RepID=UPI0026DBC147|nr:endonuclease [Deinococcus sp.]MDO4246307.1 endonuclease [Deinococcus sp.]
MNSDTSGPDLPSEVLQETQARFIQRDPERQHHLRRLNVGGPLAAESAQRVEARLTRLGVPLPEAQAVAQGEASVKSATAGLPEDVRLAAERVLGANDLVNVGYLDLARSCSRAVCRVVIRDSRGRTQGFGTGWMCSPQVMVTNNHVLENVTAARQAVIEFDYELRQDGTLMERTTFALDPDALFLTSEPLDYTFVAVRGDASAFGWLPLYGSADKNVLGESLSIIQHPSGEPKQVALRENRLVDRLPDFLHYETDTAPGSSGSPVFNDAWEVVALHHSGVPRRNDQGQVLKRDGQPLRAGESGDQIDWVANEGVRVSRLIEDLSTRTDAQGKALVHDILTPVQPPLIGSPLLPAPAVAAAPAPGSTEAATARLLDLGTLKVGPDGSVSVPVTLRLKVDTPAPTPTPEKPPVTVTPEPTPGAKRPYLPPEDAQAAAQYYAEIGTVSDPKARFLALSQLLTRTHKNQPRYNPSSEVYPWVDVWPDGKLRSIYSAREHAPEEFIAADLAAQERRARLATQEGIDADLLEDALPYNCEHVVPQSWFAKREPMRGDLHHLFSCEPDCNSFRGNTPYFDFPDYGEALRTDCGKREPGEFEPNSGKGPVARATMYFLLRYPGVIRTYSERHLQTLLGWHRADPPGEWEKHRNAAIFARQGNRNPFIDYPEWAEQVALSEGLGR